MTDTSENGRSPELIEAMGISNRLNDAVNRGEDIWNTSELQQVFIVHGFGAPYASVTRKSDGVPGSVEFLHYPRFYFDFKSA